MILRYFFHATLNSSSNLDATKANAKADFISFAFEAEQSPFSAPSWFWSSNNL